MMMTTVIVMTAMMISMIITTIIISMIVTIVTTVTAIHAITGTVMGINVIPTPTARVSAGVTQTVITQTTNILTRFITGLMVRYVLHITTHQVTATLIPTTGGMV